MFILAFRSYDLGSLKNAHFLKEKMDSYEKKFIKQANDILSSLDGTFKFEVELPKHTLLCSSWCYSESCWYRKIAIKRLWSGIKVLSWECISAVVGSYFKYRKKFGRISPLEYHTKKLVDLCIQKRKAMTVYSSSPHKKYLSNLEKEILEQVRYIESFMELLEEKNPI